MTAKARIAEAAIELLAREPDGIRHSVLIEQVKAILPDIPTNTIRGCVVGLVEHQPKEVSKPAKGLFQHTKFQDVGESLTTDVSVPIHAREQDFYAGFCRIPHRGSGRMHQVHCTRRLRIQGQVGNARRDWNSKG